MPFSSKFAIFNYLFENEFAKEGQFFDVDKDHLVFINKKELIVINNYITVPKYKLNLKKMSEFKIGENSLSFYYALFNKEIMKMFLKKIVISFINPSKQTLQNIKEYVGK